eukprot:137829_1
MSDTEKGQNTSDSTTTNPNAKYVITPDDENDEKKIEDRLLKKDKEKSSSSYYLYKSTDKEEAKKYAPKKLDTHTAKKVEQSVKQASFGSTWNTGATMEQFDYSEWMKNRIKELLLNITFKNSQIGITEVVKIDGSATILLIRGKYRPGYDISFECKWKGFCDDEKIKKAQGIVKMNDITSEDDSDDWEFEVGIKKKSKVNKQGLKIVKNDKQSILKAINIFIKEFKTKKKKKNRRSHV